MDTSLWWTSVLVWFVIILVSIGYILLVLYEIIGATIMLYKILRAFRKAGQPWGGPGTFKTALSFWWQLAFSPSINRGTYELRGINKKVQWPRPWYRVEDDNLRLPA